MQGSSSRFLHPHGEMVSTWWNTFYKFIQSEVLAGRAERLQLFAGGRGARSASFARPMRCRQADFELHLRVSLDEAAYTNIWVPALRLGGASGRAMPTKRDMRL